ncbi:deoxycytidyl transferase [Dispira parvispora]|uniref:DNA repair protein REV1 n=1 Tax=Dispira parvispora TaxID=1520584 RepID=A0A9W8AUW9_9FUNG|nr:deoxycytidyl transferase [Dispira parvispora]
MTRPTKHGGTSEYTFRDYMHNKVRKLDEQGQCLRHQNGQPTNPVPIFDNIKVFVTGYTQPSAYELRQLVYAHGGTFLHYLQASSGLVYIVATQLTPQKIRDWGQSRSYRIVTPDWLVQSVAKGKLLPWTQFQLQQLADPSLPSLAQAWGVTDHRPSESATTTADTLHLSDNTRVPKDPTTLTKGQCEPDHAHFLQRYYGSSRLHLLSTFKVELQQHVSHLLCNTHPSASDISSLKETLDNLGLPTRCIMHIDFDCFFVSAVIRNRPELQDKPVAVGYGGGKSSNQRTNCSDIASCNYVARKSGVKNGMWVTKARQLCPDLIILPYDFPAYKRISKDFYTILTKYTSTIQVTSMDEAIVDVTPLIHQRLRLKYSEEDSTTPTYIALTDYHSICLTLAKEIRRTIFETTQCHASIGISENIILARMATKRAKPAGQYYMEMNKAVQELAALPVRDLPGLGWSHARRLRSAGMLTIGDIQQQSLASLQKLCGTKLGANVYDFAHGRDQREVRTQMLRQSIGTDVNWGIRFNTHAEAFSFLKELCVEVEQRMENAQVRGRIITLKLKRKAAGAGEPEKHLGHGWCDNITKTFHLPQPTRSSDELYKICQRLLGNMHIPPGEIRGVGIQLQKLSGDQDTDPGTSGMIPISKFFGPKTNYSGSPDKPDQSTEGTINQPRTPPQQMMTVESSDVGSAPSSQISRDVWRNLPDTVKRDIKQQFIDAQDEAKRLYLSTHDENSKCTTPRSENMLYTGLKSPPTTQDFWPSPSQIDQDLLRTLPPNIQREISIIRHTRGSHGLLKPGQGKVVPLLPNGQSTLRDTLAGDVPVERTTEPDISGAHLHAAEEAIEMEPLTPYRGVIRLEDIYTFPLDIRNQVLSEYFRPRIVPDSLSPSSSEVTVSVPCKSAEIVQLPTYPSLQGHTTLEGQRQWLRQWVREFPQGAVSSDIESFHGYLKQLVIHKNLERVTLLVKYFKLQVKSAGEQWAPIWHEVVTKVNHHVLTHYQSPLFQASFM